MAHPSVYVTVYNKQTGEGQKIYRASLVEFLAAGNYTLEKPENGKAPAAPEKLPTAGRAVNREAVETVYLAHEEPEKLEAKEEAPKAEEVSADEPKKSAPRRRKPAADAE